MMLLRLLTLFSHTFSEYIGYRSSWRSQPYWTLELEDGNEESEDGSEESEDKSDASPIAKRIKN